MNLRQSVRFGTYSLDLHDERLWRDGQSIELTPKAFSLLSALVAQPGRLLTKDELFRTVWPRAVVTDATLAQCVRELRQALQDDARSPQYIETVHGRGYRFIAALTRPDTAGAEWRPSSPVVGRDQELTRLEGWLHSALGGARQVVLIAGEPGIGKTTLVQAFLSQRVANGEPAVALGRCIEQFGAGEAYLPVLEALERLGGLLGGTALREVLRRYAPSWLVQLPALTDPAEREHLQRQLAGVTRERMLREIAHALEVLSSERPLLLWLEDLHWSDYSTLDLLSCVARRTEPARLFIVGTYRPVDVVVRNHPLRDVRQELALHELCRELSLDALTPDAVERYLQARLGTDVLVAEAARFIHRRTEGNPLFMSAVVDDLVRAGAVRDGAAGWQVDARSIADPAAIPESLRQLVERQLQRLPDDDRRLLEAASVAGQSFAAEAVAAALGANPGAIDERCAEFAHAGHFLHRSVSSDSNRAGARYRFVHAFYQEVVYGRLTEARRRQLHLAIGEWQERAAAERASAIAAELAVHFDLGQDAHRAVRYLRTAAENALRQSAHAEAIAHLRRGLERIADIEPGPQQDEHELGLQLGLGAALLAAKGYGAPEVGEAYGRARELLTRMSHPPELLLAMCGLHTYYLQRGEVQVACDLAQQCVGQAQDPVHLILTQNALGTALYCLGDFVAARGHLEQAVELYGDAPRDPLLFYGRDPGVVSASYLAGALWHLGYFDQAWRHMEAALDLARAIAHPFSTVVALTFAASIEVYRRNADDGMRYAEQALATANEQRYPFFIAAASILHGYFLVQGGEVRRGIEQMQQGIAARMEAGGKVLQSFYLSLLTDAYARLGDRDAALAVVADGLALVEQTGERGYEAELYRLQGAVMAQPPVGTDAHAERRRAESSLLRAIDVARSQQTKGWELRAAIDLAHLWQDQGRPADARRLLGETYGWFTEGFDTKDMRRAGTQLRVLGAA